MESTTTYKNIFFTLGNFLHYYRSRITGLTTETLPWFKSWPSLKLTIMSVNCELGSSVGIATDYGLDGPGSNPGGDEIFRTSRPALGPTQPPVKWVPALSRGEKCGRRVLLTTHPLLVPRSWKSRAIPLRILWATSGL